MHEPNVTHNKRTHLFTPSYTKFIASIHIHCLGGLCWVFHCRLILITFFAAVQMNGFVDFLFWNSNKKYHFVVSRQISHRETAYIMDIRQSIFRKHYLFANAFHCDFIILLIVFFFSFLWIKSKSNENTIFMRFERIQNERDVHHTMTHYIYIHTTH